MSDSKIYMFPDSNSGNSSSNMDPALLLSLMNNGGFGGGNWMWMMFMWFLWPMILNGGWFGNGWGNGNNAGTAALGNMINNNDGRELLMQAIQNNGSAVQNLANMFNTSTSNIMQAINGINNSVNQVSNSLGLTGQLIINAMNLGDNSIATQISNAACGLKESITAANYQNLISNLNQTNTLASLINGVQNTLTLEFCRSGYEMAQQFCDTRQNSTNNTLSLKDTANANTLAILQKLDNIENAAMQDKINTLTLQNSALSTQINLEHLNAVTAQTVANAVNPLIAQLNAVNSKVEAIENKLPTTITTQYQPYTIIPNYGYGYYGNNAWS